MTRLVVVLAAASIVCGGDSAAQTVPDQSQAARIDPGYLRPSAFGVDPFRHILIPHWGFVTSIGASGQNNTLNFKDAGALMFLSDDSTNPDGLLYGDVLDVLGLIPRGSGLAASVQAEGGAYLGGPLGGHFSIGVTVQARGYAGASLDDDFAALLRDGNGARQEFTVGDSRADMLATSEVGAHALIRLGPVSSIDGARVTLGFGGRYIMPHFYASGSSTATNGGTISITGEGVAANVAINKLVSIPGEEVSWEDAEFSDFMAKKGSGIASDFLLRVEWPTSGLALEAMIANVGSVTMWDVEESSWSYSVSTTELEEVLDSLDADPNTDDFEFREFEVQDTSETVKVSLPRIVRFSGSAWANRILQLDVSATLPVTGDFVAPLTVDLGSTWRFSRTIPIRLGLVFGGNQGLGYTGGIGIEGRSFLMRFSGGSLGGFIQNATGVAGRFEFGFFF